MTSLLSWTDIYQFLNSNTTRFPAVFVLLHFSPITCFSAVSAALLCVFTIKEYDDIERSDAWRHTLGYLYTDMIKGEDRSVRLS